MRTIMKFVWRWLPNSSPTGVSAENLATESPPLPYSVRLKEPNQKSHLMYGRYVFIDGQWWNILTRERWVWHDNKWNEQKIYTAEDLAAIGHTVHPIKIRQV